MKKAISILTRGYADAEKYSDLILRNRSIKDFINPDGEIPLLIFHEGNISEIQQQHIRLNSLGQHLEFIDISNIWAGGYEGMCKFNIYQIFELTKEYDVVMRIDEDCIVTKCDQSPFDQIGDAPFLNSVYWAESHLETNATLPEYIRNLLELDNHDFYNNKFPYTNISAFRPEFFLSEPIYSILKNIGDSPLQRENRWGDLPVLGCILNLFAQDNVAQLSGFEYYHKSHDVIITCK